MSVLQRHRGEKLQVLYILRGITTGSVHDDVLPVMGDQTETHGDVLQEREILGVLRLRDYRCDLIQARGGRALTALSFRLKDGG